MAVEETDALIVGDTCGELVAQRFCQRGLSVVMLEAGTRFDPGADLVNSEAFATPVCLSPAPQ